jgi:hypothetical protein
MTSGASQARRAGRPCAAWRRTPACRGLHEAHRWIVEEPRGRGRDRGHGLPVRLVQPARTAAAAVPGHRGTADVGADRLARGLATGNGIGNLGADGERAARPARLAADGGQRLPGRFLGQSHLRGRHRHARDAGGGAGSPQSHAAIAARRESAGGATQRPGVEPDPVLVLRAEVAGHRRRDRGLRTPDRRARAAAHRGRAGRGRGTGQWRPAGRGGDRTGPRPSGGAGHRHSPDRAAGGARHGCLRRLLRIGATPVHLALCRSLLAGGTWQPDPGLARRSPGAPGRCRDDCGEAPGEAVLRLPERQCRDRPAHRPGKRRERAGHAQRGQVGHRRAARRRAQGERPRHRAEL